MKLVLAEKPSVAQSIAKVLGAAKREDVYFVVLERGMLCKSIRNRCSCRTVPATRRSPGLLTVSSSSVNGARPYSG